ncbi:chitinase [Hahella sp. KA22]|uniref:chitinase n=1 Tax=Hahella sp. KA22 TaxID=1628392 RepID=UPI000FDF41A0|nr:chitinase [Hahella sp. KA22]AZZ93862.1 chitinase [Hahella sp. KA22]QAY57235.1 chitinase [Hahella sp. KA22]
MCIKSSVGLRGTNSKTDVKVIQAALNLYTSDSFLLESKLTIDGQIGQKTIQAITLFQKSSVQISKPDGKVDPKGKTLKTLKQGVTKGLSEDALTAIMAHGKSSTINKYFPLLQNNLSRYLINSPLRTAHFLAQVGHESLSFRYTEELASGANYEGNLALGNTQSGDGVRFKGRGLIQLTGRSNYSEYAEYSRIDLMKKGNEVLVALTPAYALDVSLWFWNKRRLNIKADKDDLRGVTYRVNGGYTGLQDRRDYLDRAKFFLMP